MSGKVYLIGAGCGTADLITVRGLRLLQQADCVVYDALIDPALPDAAPMSAVRIPVGKRAGAHSESQERIHEILLDAAEKFGTVVRLKGGDPFVFGRGGEEALALGEAGIAYEIVPGISSCIAAPELAGIPVTHRGVSRSFHVITTHSDGGWQDVQPYAKLGGTLVFLMGFGHLREMIQELVHAGMPERTPAAVISKGGTPEQRCVRSCVAQLADDTEQAGLEAPAVIVVGETAGYSFGAGQKHPLSGISVTVTGTAHFRDKLTFLLQKNGAVVRQASRMEIVPMAWKLPDLSAFPWLVLTSANGVEQLLDKLRNSRTDLRALPRIAVIGEGTAAALERHGLFPDLLPEEFTAASLGKALAKTVQPGERVLILRAAQGSPALPLALDAAEIPYTDIRTYDVRLTDKPGHADSDYLVFASASGVRAYYENGGTAADHTQILCIGAVTAEVISQYTANYRIAARPAADGILQTILEDHHA